MSGGLTIFDLREVDFIGFSCDEIDFIILGFVIFSDELMTVGDESIGNDRLSMLALSSAVGNFSRCFLSRTS